MSCVLVSTRSCRRRARNRQCNCLAIFRNRNARSSIVRYMTWFARQTQYEQNSIVLQWIRYLTLLRMEGQSRLNYFWLPYIDDGTEDIPERVRDHVVCTRGLRFILGFGRSRYQRIRKVSLNSAVFPRHKAVGKPITMQSRTTLGSLSLW